MADPVVDRSDLPHTFIKIDDSNVTSGTYSYQIARNSGTLETGFNIHTGTLTACDIKVKASNIDTETPVDITNDLFGVTTLASDSNYLVTVPVAAGLVTIEVTITAEANAIDFSFFAPRG
jgi:endoglucanase Acf2